MLRFMIYDRRFTNQGTSFGGLLGKIMAEIEMFAPSFSAINREINLERAKPSRCGARIIY